MWKYQTADSLLTLLLIPLVLLIAIRLSKKQPDSFDLNWRNASPEAVSNDFKNFFAN
jgi:hypothetical protein